MDDPTDNFLHVKEEVTSDVEMGGSQNNRCDRNEAFYHTQKQQNDNSLDIKKELVESILPMEPTFVKVENFPIVNEADMTTCNIDNSNEKDEIPSIESDVNNVTKSNEEADASNTGVGHIFATFKCTICYKVFLGHEAYYTHIMNHHTMSLPRREKPPAAIKVGDTPAGKGIVVKVKKIKNPIKDYYENILNNYLSKISTHTAAPDKFSNDNSDPFIRSVKTTKCKKLCSGNRQKYSNNDPSDTAISNNTLHNIDPIVHNVKVKCGNGVSLNSQNNCNDSDPLHIDSNAINMTTIRTVENEGNQDELTEMPATSDNGNEKTNCDKSHINEKLCTQPKPKESQRTVRSRNVNVSSYTCTLCKYTCKTKSLLQTHTRTTHNHKKKFCCHLCDYKCVRKRHLDQHMDDIHLNTILYSCTYCDYECIERSQLDKHKLVHSQVKLLSCTLCDYKCIQQSHLDQHIHKHTEAETFFCTLCDYKCTQKCDLYQHMQGHDTQKSYSCTICSYKCIQRSKLDQHIRMHTEATPFLCTFCDYKCTQRSHLDHHMRRHTGIETFSCTFCDYKCIKRIHLDQHIRNKHRNVEPN